MLLLSSQHDVEEYAMGVETWVQGPVAESCEQGNKISGASNFNRVTVKLLEKVRALGS